MNRFIEHIEASCKNLDDKKNTYRYKRKILEDMNALADYQQDKYHMYLHQPVA